MQSYDKLFITTLTCRNFFTLFIPYLYNKKDVGKYSPTPFFSSFFAYITIFLPDYHVFVIPGSNQQHNLHACPTGTYR